ncbi:hypothetical protein LINGRAHAP2_LOCUS31517 [Linum grandiflorum]
MTADDESASTSLLSLSADNFEPLRRAQLCFVFFRAQLCFIFSSSEPSAVEIHILSSRPNSVRHILISRSLDVLGKVVRTVIA